jgi:hypothetical protein
VLRAAGESVLSVSNPLLIGLVFDPLFMLEQTFIVKKQSSRTFKNPGQLTLQSKLNFLLRAFDPFAGLMS